MHNAHGVPNNEKFQAMKGMLLTKTTAALNEVVLCYHKVRGLDFPAVIFAVTISIVDFLINLFFPGPLAFCKKAVERVNSKKKILNR